MRLPILGGLFLGLVLAAASDAPDLAAWKLNTTGQTGYGGLPANVQQVRYSAANVYTNSSGIPSYSIGPWPQNPNTPTNQNYLLRFPRQPQVKTGTKTNTPLGRIGLLTNGVPIYNAMDGRSYNNQNIWHQNANVVEAVSFDSCLGHPDNGGHYHHHEIPTCLDAISPSQHAPIFGYAFDGYPIYGPYGYANADGSGGVRRILTSYRLRSITQRTTLPNGTVLTPSQYGPAVSSTYPLGYYLEDYEYVAGLGDLDAYNGRFAVTPDYPAGTYSYVITVDASGNGVYPYIIGPQYYGQVVTEDLGQGTVVIAETVTAYSGTATPTSTAAATATATNTATSTATAAPTATSTAEPATSTATSAPTSAPTATATAEPATSTPSSTATEQSATSTPSSAPTSTAAPTATAAPATPTTTQQSATSTATAELATSTPMNTATAEPATSTPISTATAKPATPTATQQSATSTATAASTSTGASTATPRATTDTATAAPTAAPSATRTATATPNGPRSAQYLPLLLR